MKKVQSLFASLALITLFAMSSCSSDEEQIIPRGSATPQTDYSAVYGKWKIKSLIASTSFDLDGDGVSNVDILNYEMDDKECYTDKTWNFDNNQNFYFEDGSMMCESYQSVDYKGTFDLDKAAGKIEINYDDPDKINEIFTIKDVSPSLMLLERTILLSDEGEDLNQNGFEPEPGTDVIGQEVKLTYTFRNTAVLGE